MKIGKRLGRTSFRRWNERQEPSFYLYPVGPIYTYGAQNDAQDNIPDGVRNSTRYGPSFYFCYPVCCLKGVLYSCRDRRNAGERHHVDVLKASRDRS